MAASKGYGPDKSPGNGRGAYSAKKNMAPVPRKGSSLNMSPPVGGQDRSKVMEMGRMAMKGESLRGKAS